LAVSGINIWERICSLLNRWRNHLWAEPCTFNLEYHCVPFVKERGKENGKRRKRKGKEKGERKKGEQRRGKGKEKGEMGIGEMGKGEREGEREGRSGKEKAKGTGNRIFLRETMTVDCAI
jgi:hypothetical protein